MWPRKAWKSLHQNRIGAAPSGIAQFGSGFSSGGSLRSPLLLFGRERQTESRHLLAVANQHSIANQHWMVPRLAFDRLESRNFLELRRSRGDQREFAFFRYHQQQILIG